MSIMLTGTGVVMALATTLCIHKSRKYDGKDLNKTIAYFRLAFLCGVISVGSFVCAHQQKAEKISAKKSVSIENTRINQYE